MMTDEVPILSHAEGASIATSILPCSHIFAARAHARPRLRASATATASASAYAYAFFAYAYAYAFTPTHHRPREQARSGAT